MFSLPFRLDCQLSDPHSMDNHHKPQPPLCTTCNANIFENKNLNLSRGTTDSEGKYVLLFEKIALPLFSNTVGGFFV